MKIYGSIVNCSYIKFCVKPVVQYHNKSKSSLHNFYVKQRNLY